MVVYVSSLVMIFNTEDVIGLYSNGILAFYTWFLLYVIPMFIICL